MRTGVLELVDARVELLDDRAERHDVEHPLALTDEVDEILAGLCEHRVGAVQHQARGRDLRAHVRTEVLDRLAGRLQRDARVEKALDDLERDEVAIRVAALGATALRVREGRSHQVGAGPVVELAVRDADQLADLRSPEAGVGLVLVLHRRPRVGPATWCTRAWRPEGPPLRGSLSRRYRRPASSTPVITRVSTLPRPAPRRQRVVGLHPA